MSVQFALPELGEGVMEGELVTWRVKAGDEVNHDQPLCEVMTDKATIEIPSPVKAKVVSVHATEGHTVKVGDALITFDGGDSDTLKGRPAHGAGHSAPAPAPAPAAKPAPAPAPVAKAAPAPAPTTHASNGSGATAAGPALSVEARSQAARVMAAPSTRRFARERGVELGAVVPSGPAGRVMREDVDRFIREGGIGSSGGITARRGRASSAPTGGEERVAFKGLRKKIAEKMAESKHKAAHFTYVEEADATELVRLREAAKEAGAAQGIKVTFLPIVMKAMVEALRKYPILNSTLDEATSEIVYKHYYNIGLSVQTEDGLTAPVVKNVENKSVLELAAEIQDLVSRARAKKLTREDLTGGTITLTNAGSIGGLFATPIINFPEVAILGFNKIFRKPVVKTIRGVEKIVIRDWTYFSISLDHRIVDGAIAAEFMKEFIKIIEQPSLMMLDRA
ncbi:MAG TPA: dihydrolipoamide acetyltransferase family protein [Bdellovibrionota bacterium]|jgi:pyruvate dehydrogenase E2 component (dihydrolipoamide acetyltransferase)|nr:dihydrolipoamide acetyltransferase family protein [Bdellovibrionota bacterium]